MKKMILKLYSLAAILFAFFAVYGILNLRVSIQRDTPQTDFVTLTSVSKTTVRKEEAPTGERIVLQYRVEDVKGDYNALVFYTLHQNVEVFLGSDCIYSIRAVPGLLLPKSPGCIYNIVELDESANGKWLHIELEPVYEGADTVSELYFGSRYQIVQSIISSHFLTVLLCVLTILIGGILLLFAFGGRSTAEKRKTMEYLGLFSAVIGIWKLLDCDIMGLFCAQCPAVSILPYFAMLLLPIMAVEFIRNLTAEKKTVVWDIPEVVNVITVAAILVLQLLGIADYRESLWMIHGCMLISGICVMIGLLQMVKRYGWTRNVKMSLAGAGCCMLWMAIDLLTYYGSDGTGTFPLSMLIFLIFLIIIVVDRLRQSRERMQEGMHARQYKKLAYHDALTGFFNRAAYTEHIASPDFSPQRSVMVAFDLNNLKKCNDELGHDKGDIYIKESARILMDTFGELGKCYRLGGDEFGAILSGVTMEECAACAQRMRERVDRFNQASWDIHMGIACGYAVFDPKEDEDIHGTIRRADKMMYEEKFRMKQIKA